MYTTYAKTDAQDRITELRSSFHGETAGMLEIGRDASAYGLMEKYCPKGLYENHKIPRYKLVNGEAIERAQAEIDADIAAQPVPAPTQSERLAAAEEAILGLMMGA